jgi:hypothetical protein
VLLSSIKGRRVHGILACSYSVVCVVALACGVLDLVGEPGELRFAFYRLYGR